MQQVANHEINSGNELHEDSVVIVGKGQYIEHCIFSCSSYA